MATFNVSNTTEFATAAGNAAAGDTIALAAGTYDLIRLDTGFTNGPYDPEITITSQDTNNRAVVNELYSGTGNGFILSDLKFQYVYSDGDLQVHKPFKVEGGSNITIKDSTFAGDGADQYGNGIGLHIRNSNGVVCDNCVFQGKNPGTNDERGFAISVDIYNTTDTTIKNCDISTNVRDAMNVAGSVGVLIENNYIHDSVGRGDGAHRDMIQLYSSGQIVRMENITIRGNTIDCGSGAWVQSIFIRNELVDTGAETFADMAYKNILIEDNVVYAPHIHGITVGETDGLTIRNNTLVRVEANPADISTPELDNAGTDDPRLTVVAACVNVSITDNVITKFGSTIQGGWTETGNIVLLEADSAASNSFTSIFDGPNFVGGVLTYDAGGNDWTVKSGSLADTNQAGAPRLLPGGGPALPVMGRNITINLTAG